MPLIFNEYKMLFLSLKNSQKVFMVFVWKKKEFQNFPSSCLRLAFKVRTQFYVSFFGFWGVHSSHTATLMTVVFNEVAKLKSLTQNDMAQTAMKDVWKRYWEKYPKSWLVALCTNFIQFVYKTISVLCSLDWIQSKLKRALSSSFFFKHRTLPQGFYFKVQRFYAKKLDKINNDLLFIIYNEFEIHKSLYSHGRYVPPKII